MSTLQVSMSLTMRLIQSKSFFLKNYCLVSVGLRYDIVFKPVVTLAFNGDRIILTVERWETLLKMKETLLTFFTSPATNLTFGEIDGHKLLLNRAEGELVIKNKETWHTIRLCQDQFLHLLQLSSIINAYLKELFIKSGYVTYCFHTAVQQSIKKLEGKEQISDEDIEEVGKTHCDNEAFLVYHEEFITLVKEGWEDYKEMEGLIRLK